MFFTGHEKRLWLGYRLTNMPPLILFGVIATVMVWKMWGRVLSRGRLLLFLLFVAICAGPFAFDLVQGTYSVAWPRYAIVAWPAAYLLAAVGLTCFRSRTAMVILILIVLAWVPNLLGLKRTRFWWAPTREISQTLWIDSSPSDLVLVHSIPSGVISIARYATGPAKKTKLLDRTARESSSAAIDHFARPRAHSHRVCEGA